MRKLFDLVGKITVEGIEGLQKNLQAINKSAESVVKPLAKMGNQMTRLGAQMSKNLTVPIAAAGVAIYKGVEAASDLAETVSKVNQIFGESAGTINEWSNTTAKSIGQSKQQAMDAASTFAIFGKSAGKTGKDLSDFSIQMATLASDLASFHNTSPEEAITAIGAAMRGENEPMRRYGVLLDDASMRQKALELGIVSTIKNALTPQQKVLAAQALILEQTRDAQGDFTRTSGGLANQTRIWKAEVADLTAKLGQSFLPIALSVTKVFRESFLPMLEKIVNWWNDLPKGLQETVVKFGAFIAIAGPAVLLLGQIVSSVTMITTGLKTAQIALAAFNATMLANPFGLVVLGIAAATGAIIGLVNEYKTLQKEHQKYTLMTVDQAKKNDYVKGYDELVAKIRKYGDVLKDEAQFNQLLGKSIEELTSKARELGFTIEGNNEERLKALNTISLELQGVRDTNGQLITYTGSIEKNTDAKGKNKQKTEEQLEAEKKLAEQRAEFEKGWSDKAYDSGDSKLDVLNRQEMDAIASANKIGADTTAITAYYSGERQKLLDEEREAERSANREKILLEIEDGKRITEDKLKNEKKIADEKEKLDQQEQERRSYLKDTIANGISQTFGLLSQLSQNRIQQIDNELKTDIAAIETSKMTQEEKEKAILELQTKADKKKRELQRKAAIAEKAGAIFSIVLSTAQAIMKAVSQLGPIAGAIAGVAMGILGAAQIALVASKPIPLKKGGLAKATNGGIDAVVAEGGQDELVLPLKTGVQMLVDEFLSRLSNVSLPEPQFSKSFSGNQNDSIINNHSSLRPININVGTLVADELGVKRFAQTIKKYLIMEDQRISVSRA